MTYLDPMRNEVTRELLCYAAGRAIFCPKCQSVMDWKTTVITGSLVTCETCWRDACQQILDKRGADEFLAILNRADITSAHNWHVENGQLVRGAQLITD